MNARKLRAERKALVAKWSQVFNASNWTSAQLHASNAYKARITQIDKQLRTSR